MPSRWQLGVAVTTVMAGYSLGMPAVKIRVALAALLTVVLAGCSSDSHPYDGPLSSAAGLHDPIPRGGNCITFPPSTRAQAFADQTFTNYGHVTVVLDRIVVLHPHNFRLIAAYAIPGTGLVGILEWPPSYRPRWSHRKPIRGYRVAPRQSFNMVVGGEPAGPGKATSQGLLLYYHDSAGSYVAPNYFAMDVAPGRNGCNNLP
jgi:hypothetical protein